MPVHPRHLSCPGEKIPRFAKESGIKGWRVVRGNKGGGSSSTYEVQFVKKEASYRGIKSSPFDLGSQACISHSGWPLPHAFPWLQGSSEVERTSIGWSSLFFHNALGRTTLGIISFFWKFELLVINFNIIPLVINLLECFRKMYEKATLILSFGRSFHFLQRKSHQILALFHLLGSVSPQVYLLTTVSMVLNKTVDNYVKICLGMLARVACLMTEHHPWPNTQNNHYWGVSK